MIYLADGTCSLCLIIFNNKGLLIGGRPVTYSVWEKGGIQFLGDIFGLDGLRSFQDIKNSQALPSFFIYS